MAGTLATVLILLISITFALLLFTALNWALSFAIFDPSRHDVRNLLVALEDLALPMGSFPVNILHPWTSTDPGHHSVPTSTVPEQTAAAAPPLVYQLHLLPPQQYHLHPAAPPLSVLPAADLAPQLYERFQDSRSQDEDCTAAVDELRTKSLAFEKDIRKRVDPQGKTGLDLQNLAKLVAEVVKQHSKAEQTLEEKVKESRRAEKKLWKGQIKLWSNENHKLRTENYERYAENVAWKGKLQRRTKEYNNRLTKLNAEKLFAERTEEEALAKVEDRINVVKDKYERRMVTLEDKSFQEKNSLICSARMDKDKLRNELRLAEQQEKQCQDDLKDKDTAISWLQAKLKKSELTATISVERADSTEEDRKRQLEAQRKENEKIVQTLNTQLRESKLEVISLKRWEATGKGRQAKIEQLSKQLSEQIQDARENRENIRKDKDLEISRRDRAIQTHEAEIERLRGVITSLEAGEEIQILRSQLRENEKQLEESRAKAKKLEGSNKARDKKISQGVELSRKLEKAQSEAETARTNIQHLQDEKRHTATEHGRIVKEKDDEIQRLRQAVQQLEIGKESSREAQEKATKSENDLRNEMEILKAQVKVAEPQSADPAGSHPSKEAQEGEVLLEEANDANNLLVEIGNICINKDSTEQIVLCALNKVKVALHSVRAELRKPDEDIQKSSLIKYISKASISEAYIGQLQVSPQLIQQAKAANARLRKLETILATDGGAIKASMLEALNTKNPFVRAIRKTRNPKRLAQPGAGVPISNPATDVQTGHSMGESEQKNETPEQRCEQSLSTLHHVQPQVEAANSQDQIRESAQNQGGEPASGSVSQPDAKAVAQSVPNPSLPLPGLQDKNNT